jgi:uncharacterized membrane protein
MSDPPNPRAPANREFIFRMIQLLMLADMLIGVVLVVLGLFVFDLVALVVGGAVLAAMGLGLALIFRMLARREATATGRASGRASPHELRR